ncbi:hypothetical protein [Erythrobacter sp. JK5]|uniref:hypothetical protein n=1 Tax=Erythrobacter sp. JK5 TaxID=2829500 RepID=UPI002012D6E8|nr:hypothetical protein [Erythrobacter sp. JK5]
MRVFLRAAALAVSLILSPIAVQAQEPPTLAEYGKLPDVEEAVLSPSGKRLAVLTNIDGKRTVVAVEDRTKLVSRFEVGDLKIRWMEWIGDDRLLMVTSRTQDLGYNFTTDKAEFFTARVLPMAEGVEGGLIFGNRRELVDAIIGDYGIRNIDGRWYGFYGAIQLTRSGRMEYEFDHGRPYLYRVDLQDFSVKKIANAARPGHDTDWLIDAAGEVAATLDIDDNTGEWDLRGPGNGVIAKGVNRGGRVGLVGLGYDGTSVILAERGENGIEWYEVPLAGGAMTPFLADVDVDRVFFDDSTGHMMGYLEGART